MAGEDAQGARAGRPRRLHVGGLLHAQHDAAHGPDVDDAPGYAEDDDDLRDARSQQRHDRDDQEQPRERLHGIHHPLRNQVHRAAEVSQQEAAHRGDRHRNEAGGDADQHRDAGALHHPAVHVAPKLIGAQGIVGRWPLQTPRDVLLEHVVGGEHVGEDADQQEQHHDDQAGGAQLLLLEQPREGVAQEGLAPGLRGGRRLPGRRGVSHQS